MMIADYSIIANGFTPSTTTANIIPSPVMNPIVTSPQQVVVIPRSKTETLDGIPSFPTPTVANFASLAGGNPISNPFALASMAPNSATTLADGTPLYTDSTVFKVLNTGGLPLANTSSLFASSIQPQGTNLSTLGGLGSNITAVPSLASPRSLSALPTDNTPSASDNSTANVFQLLAGLIDPKNSASGVDETNPNPVSNEELLSSIRELKAIIIAKKDRDNEEMNPSEEATNPKTLTLVSASPSLAAAKA